MTNFLFVKSTDNIKTGPIPVVYVDERSCPDLCPLKIDNSCYAKHGPIGMVWRKLDTNPKTIDVEVLFNHIRTIPKGHLWRYGVVGDLPGNNDDIDAAALEQIVQANKGRRGFAYTHKSVGFDSVGSIMNMRAIENANLNGFTINLSADDLEEADELADLGIGPVVVTLPTDAPDYPTRTPKGRVVGVCPAERREDVNCQRCGICADPDRKMMVGFRAHGIAKNRINRRLKGKRVLPVIQQAA